MARPEQPLDRDGSPLRELAFWLRDLRAASNLTYAQLAKRSGYSVSTLQEAAAGRRLPTQAVTLAFAGACGADTETWRVYWVQIRRALDASLSTQVEDLRPPWISLPAVVENHVPSSGDKSESTDTLLVDDALTSPVDKATPSILNTASLTYESAGQAPRPWWRSRLRLIMIAGGVLIAGVIVAVALIAADEKPPVSFASVVVQNKVAIGESSLIEDSSPSYLSSETIARCARRGCKLQDTEMHSGAKLVVTCWTHGQELTNENVTSAGITHNPGGISSDLWYRALWSDGRHGYISQVYIAPKYRGTMDLRQCS